MSLLDQLKSPEVMEILRQKVILPAIAQALKEQGKREEVFVNQALRLNELEQYSRKNCVVINGVKESSDENVVGLVIEIARLIGVTVNAEDIDNAHRMGKAHQSQSSRGRQFKPRPIIVKFVSFRKRSEFFAERKTIRDATVDSESTFPQGMLESIFVADCLTKYNGTIMYVARQLKRDNRLEAAWSDAGRLKVRVSNGGPTIVIRSLNDLKNITGNHPSFSKATVDHPEFSTSSDLTEAEAEAAAPADQPARPAETQAVAAGDQQAPDVRGPAGSGGPSAADSRGARGTGTPSAGARTRAAAGAAAAGPGHRDSPRDRHQSSGGHQRRGRGGR